MSTSVSVGSGPRTAYTTVALLPPPSGKTGVVESWFQTIEETDVAPAAAAVCAFSETVGADEVETVSPAEART